MKTIAEFKIQSWQDREAVVKGLANAGYFVAVEERKIRPYSTENIDFYVVAKETSHEQNER